MSEDSKIIKVPEIQQLEILGEKFNESEILDTLELIDSISKKMEVGARLHSRTNSLFLIPSSFQKELRVNQDRLYSRLL